MKRLVTSAVLMLLYLPLWAEDSIDVPRDVSNLFQQYCVSCHGPTKQKGGMRLDGLATLRGDARADLLNTVRERTRQMPEAASEAYDVLLPISVQDSSMDRAGEETLSEGLQQLLV